MKKVLEKNEIEIAIANIYHNLQCIEEAEKNSKEDIKKDFIAEKKRLTRVLNKYLKLAKEGK